ncbi:MAG: DUF1294 domain-containing protein [Lachnospiraceae bacterium]|nr:DUF1294 domain-containing protein [Lachnospiraceae bacterium]
MDTVFFFFWLYVLIINFISFAIYGIDKQKAVDGQWRIPENTLLFTGFIGGAVGSFIGMKFFRHKTKKLKFRILVPIFILLNLAVMVFVLWWAREFPI